MAPHRKQILLCPTFWIHLPCSALRFRRIFPLSPKPSPCPRESRIRYRGSLPYRLSACRFHGEHSCKTCPNTPWRGFRFSQRPTPFHRRMQCKPWESLPCICIGQKTPSWLCRKLFSNPFCILPHSQANVCGT